jgi:glycosyltransferase involved in cell wall biosynthesis
MKLIFVNRFFYPDLSATSQLLSDLAFALASEGAQVHVITSRSRYDEVSAKLPPSDVEKGVTIHRIWTSRFGRSRLLGRSFDYLSFYLMAGWALWRLASRGDMVVIKTDPPLFSVVALPVLKLRRARLVNWLQDVFPEVAIRSGLVSETGLITGLIIRLRNWSLRTARFNVAISPGMREHLIACDLDAERVRVNPNWADGDLVYPVPEDQNPLREDWGLQGKFVVGYSGNLGRIHDTETIRHAVEQIRESLNVTFLFIGGGSGYASLENENKQGRLKCAEFQPYQPREQLHLSLSVPDVHLVSLAPAMEGLAFASKLYGILAAGRPTIYIGAPRSETAKLLEDAGCGIGLEAGKPEALIAAIQHLKDNPKVCQVMGRRARYLFEREYDKDIAIRRWRQLLLPNDARKTVAAESEFPFRSE